MEKRSSSAADEFVGVEFGGNLGLQLGDGLESVDLLVGVSVAEAAVAAVAALVIGEGFEQMDAAKVGPEPVGDEDLGVGDLPEQEVRDALLAAGANDQIGVRHVRRVEGAADGG